MFSDLQTLHLTALPHTLCLSHPDLSLPTTVSSTSTAAAPAAQASVLGGRLVLVHRPAVGDEAQAQLEVSGQAAIRRQCQDQQRSDQEEAHHQQSHTASISQQVGAVGGRPMRTDCRVAEEAKHHHDNGWRQDAPEHQTREASVDGGNDEVLSCHQH